VFKLNDLDDDEPLDPRVVPQRSDYANLRIKAPVFVARQLVKHQKELVWSEVSRRYISSEPELWWPKKWHKAPTHSKQGASDEEFDPEHIYWTQSAYMDATDTGPGGEIETVVNWGDSARHAVEQYSKAIEAGMAPEEARMILPQNMMTEWIWTGSRRAFARVIRERTAPGAQQSGTRETAEKIEEALQQRK
jgi:thymidylate synthase (FAD)